MFLAFVVLVSTLVNAVGPIERDSPCGKCADGYKCLPIGYIEGANPANGGYQCMKSSTDTNVSVFNNSGTGIATGPNEQENASDSTPAVIIGKDVRETKGFVQKISDWLKSLF